MKPRISLLLLALGFPALLVSWWLPPPVGTWSLVVLNALLPPALIAFALPTRPRLKSLRIGLAGVALLLALGLGGIVWTSGDPAPALAGLPASALWLLLGLWIVPLLVVCALYTWSFDRFADPQRTLERLRPYLGAEHRSSKE